MKGTASLGASGKYLSRSDSSTNKAEVSLCSNIYSSYKELDLKGVIGKNKIKASHANSNATHIVVAMKCGAHANFNFERTISSEENKQNVEGELKGAIQNIPLVAGNNEGSVRGSWKKTETKNTDKISCKFFGDLILEKTPTTYEEAVLVYKTLPELVKNANAPVTVWLYPLSLMYASEDSYIERKIKDDDLKQVVETFDRLSTLIAESNELLEKPSSVYIPEVQSKLRKFAAEMQSTKNTFRAQIDEMLRDGENTVQNYFDRMSLHSKEEWLLKAKTELGLLDCYLAILSESSIHPSDHIEFETKILENDHVVRIQISLPLLKQTQDKQLVQPETFKSKKGKSWPTNTGHKSSTNEFEWYSNSAIKSEMRKAVKGIQHLLSENNEIAVVVIIHDEAVQNQNECINVTYFQNGEILDVKFDILAKENVAKLPILELKDQQESNND